MGSNVSRHTGKGLSGRRSQSSGNLCNGKQSSSYSQTVGATKTKSTNVKLKTKRSEKYEENFNDPFKIEKNKKSSINNKENYNKRKEKSFDETCSGVMAPLCNGLKDRTKFCGSLPNHLDIDDVDDNILTQSTNLYYEGENNDTSENVEYVTVAPRKQPYHHELLEQQHNQQQLHHHQQQQPAQSSPYNNSSSGKGSITSSTNLGSNTFKNNTENRPDLQLKLPFYRPNVDTGCDQGYGSERSERSPEDEMPPPMPLLISDGIYADFLSSADGMPLPEYVHQNWNISEHEYNFITKDCTFIVQLTKGPRGLGLSVSGGLDSNAAFPGLIRIKRLFPHQAAWSTGMLQPGDILLEVNGIPLTGLTNYEALEVLRTTPNNVKLVVCRPRDERYRKLSPPTDPPKPPQRQDSELYQQQFLNAGLPLEPLDPIQINFSGEFEIYLTKQQGSLGFTLRKEDESILGHYVRALVRDPALNDGRIKPGDKIVAVNDVPLSPMTHEEAVIFLRQAADTVKLRLYRDEASTPVAALSPTNPENKSFANTIKSRAMLRPEAINLINDLAYRKQVPEDSTGSSIRSNSSPRRLKRGMRNNNNSSSNSQTELESTGSSSQKYLLSSQTSTCSDSETSTFSQCSLVMQPNQNNDTFIVCESSSGEHHHCHRHHHVHHTQNDPDESLEYYEEDELFQMVDDDGEDRPDRPNFLDLAGKSGSTPVSSRKPRFQFTLAANSYELNNLDNEALDAPIYGGSTSINQNLTSDNGNLDNFNSLPCETFLVACMTESDLNNSENFKHKSPLYQSVVVQPNNKENMVPNNEENKIDGTKSLLKWKGIMLSPDEEKLSTPGADSSCDTTTVITNPTPGTDKDLDFNGFTKEVEGYKTIVVELNRGWNSRLGFSLQPEQNTTRTLISAIYNDSVAARDGRLKVGDHIVMVNDETVENLPTSEIIDLLRIIRGSICLTVLRKEEKET